MNDEFPSTLSTKLRACKNCSLIKSASHFRKHGCDNCSILTNDPDLYSSKFKGMISLVQPEKSWVARWQRISECKKGLYAMTVEGMLNDECIHEIEKTGRVYYDRNESFKLE